MGGMRNTRSCAGGIVHGSAKLNQFGYYYYYCSYGVYYYGVHIHYMAFDE